MLVNRVPREATDGPMQRHIPSRVSRPVASRARFRLNPVTSIAAWLLVLSSAPVLEALVPVVKHATPSSRGALRQTRCAGWSPRPDAWALFREMAQKSQEPDVVCRELSQAGELRTVEGYAAAMCERVRAQGVEPTLELLDDIRLNGVAPYAISFTTAISACEKGGLWKRALELLDEMPQAGVEPDLFSFSAAISACEKSDQRHHTLEVLRKMQQSGIKADAVPVMADISACEKGDVWKVALELLSEEPQEEVEEPQDGVEDDESSFSAVLSDCVKRGDWKRALEVLDEMREAGVKPGVESFSAAISAYSQGGQWKQAMEVFELMRQAGVKPDATIFNTAISACHNDGKRRRTLELLGEMRQAGFTPAVESFGAAISACEKRRQWDLTLELFEEMREANLTPDAMCFKAAIAACKGGGQWKRARELEQEMQPVGGDSDVETMSQKAALGQNVALARMLSRRTNQRQPQRGSVQVQTFMQPRIDDEETLERAAQIIGEASRICVLTGAGISTDSGIPDFRGPEGLWTKNPKAELASNLNHWQTDSSVRTSRWAELLHLRETGQLSWHPNAGHKALADLVRADRVNLIVTQNTDGLQQAAGVPADRVVEIHGSIAHTGCLQCGNRVPLDATLDRVAAGEADPRCVACGGLLKTATISFGQSVVAEDVARALDAAKECDVLLAVGSTLGVYPIMDIVPQAVRSGAKVVIVNAQATKMDHLAAVHLYGGISDVLPRIVSGATSTASRIEHALEEMSTL